MHVEVCTAAPQPCAHQLPHVRGVREGQGVACGQRAGGQGAGGRAQGAGAQGSMAGPPPKVRVASQVVALVGGEVDKHVAPDQG